MLPRTPRPAGLGGDVCRFPRPRRQGEPLLCTPAFERARAEACRILPGAPRPRPQRGERGQEVDGGRARRGGGGEERERSAVQPGAHGRAGRGLNTAPRRCPQCAQQRPRQQEVSEAFVGPCPCSDRPGARRTTGQARHTSILWCGPAAMDSQRKSDAEGWAGPAAN